MSPTLGQLAAMLSGQLLGDANIVPSGVQHDSRQVESGDVFVAISGEQVDGRRFAQSAVDAGAACVFCETELNIEGSQVVVPDAREALALAAQHVYGRPTSRLQVVGITGTNGKTTSTWLLSSILKQADHQVAILGTVASAHAGASVPSAFTTPEADVIARFARDAVEVGSTHLLMEVSSHGLEMKRADGIDFAVAGFLNFSQDHLDFHGTMDAYAAAKSRLFTELNPGASIINVDDELGRRLESRLRSEGAKVWSCSPTGEDADIRANVRSVSASGMVIELETPAGALSLRSPLIGRHNAENLCVAVGSALLLGVDGSLVEEAVSEARGAPGRLEAVGPSEGAAVVVDYAHTPDALVRVIQAVREVTAGRVIVVFGCGGDRDRLKRPLMGAAASAGGDLCVVTSDNPRTENPAAIIEDILPGMTDLPRLEEGEFRDAARGWCVEVDRERAIHLAVASARPGDAVLIAGKGHEDYQIVGTKKLPFDDREVVGRALGVGV